MMQVLEVREFEKIIEANEKNQNLKRFDTQYQCLDKKTFHEFLEFIHEFEQKEENADILNFITIGYKKALGQTITFKNYSRSPKACEKRNKIIISQSRRKS